MVLLLCQGNSQVFQEVWKILSSSAAALLPSFSPAVLALASAGQVHGHLWASTLLFPLPGALSPLLIILSDLVLAPVSLSQQPFLATCEFPVSAANNAPRYI